MIPSALLLVCANPEASGGIRQGPADSSTTPAALAEGCHTDPLPSSAPRAGLVAFRWESAGMLVQDGP